MAEPQETVFTVRKAPTTNKVMNVMRFMSGASVDIRTWKEKGERVKLEREGGNVNNKHVEDDQPRFGAGSEFGRIERKEAREAKYRPRKIREQPWSLVVKPHSSKSSSRDQDNKDNKEKDIKKYSGKKDGGVMDNSSYYVFFQAHDGAFEALPVNEWINFTPVQRFKALTAEQAEEQFEKRDKIMNFFPLMKGVKKEDGSDVGTAGDGQLKKVKKERRSFKVSELDDWGGVNDSDFDSSDGEDKVAKGKNKKRGKKKKGSDDDRSEAGEDSDEGDFDQRELDYMSESSDSESEPEDVRVNKELKSVADEEGLRKIAASDEEDSEKEDKDDNDNGNKDIDKMDIDGNPIKEKVKKIKKERLADGGEISESSAEDSDDSDIDESKPWSQLNNKSSKSSVKSGTSSEHGSAPTSRAVTPVKEVPDSKSVVQGIKRKLIDSTPASPAQSSSSASNPSTPTPQASSSAPQPLTPTKSPGQPPAKKVKSNDNDGQLSEEAVRRYLARRPMTVKDLIRKFRKSHTSGSKSDLMNSIATILKKIDPDKQTIRGELHLSLKAPK